MKDIDEISQGKMVTKNTTEQSIVTKPVITKEQWLVLGTLMLGVFMGAIDISIVSPALPAIAQKLSIDSRQLSWVITLYLLVYVVATPLMSALSVRWGRRRIFIFDVLIFGIGSLWAAFSGSLFHLLSARDLPRAYYSAVIFVIALCVMVAIVTVGSLPIAQIVNACDYALAAAAKPFMGQAGFTLIAIAALLSTVSAIDATLYGAAQLHHRRRW
jgi:predicted MFS family arabinose efflux permease